MNWFHVTIEFSRERTRNLNPVLDSLGEWVQYASNSWVVKTEVSGEALRDRVKDHVGEYCFILVAILDTKGTWGVLPMSVWDWFKAHGVNFTVTQ
jgi:hypothetical protein